MNLADSAEEIVIRESARKMLEGQCPPALVRRLLDPGSDGHSAELWSSLADGGWIGLALPEEDGGTGGTLVDLGVFFREAGRVLLPTTFASTVFAAHLIRHLGRAAQRAELLPGIAGGDTIATVAYLEPGVRHDWRKLETVARPLPDGAWELSGEKLFVANASRADLLVVLARIGAHNDQETLAAFAVDPGAVDGIAVTPMRTFAGDRQAVVRLDRVVVAPTALLGEGAVRAETSSRFEHVLDVMTALQCMEMSGGAERVVELTAAYVSARIQFGRPIGSFQAVQHHVADMGMQVEGALLLSTKAVASLAAGRRARRDVSHAKAWISRAYPDITMRAHQVWGGMGYVTETDLHLYSNRAKATEVSFGTASHHLRRAAGAIGL
jgi:alkylation response protein AidB-like acyl-CoA dehydrogenase